MNAELYNALATLLSYPDDGYAGSVRQAIAAIGDRPSVTGSELAIFAELTQDMQAHELQELFIQTFDLSPMCSLEMGWHLFGENYDRGLLLVKMRQLLRGHGIAEEIELPDHLTYALRLTPRLQPGEAEDFVGAIVLPALRKMRAALEGKNNPYEHLLGAVERLLRADFPEVEMASAATGGELRVLA